MKPALLRLTAIGFLLFYYINPLSAQNDGFNTGLNNTIITLPCNQNCVTQAFKIPHLKSTSDYTISTIPYKPYPYTTTGGSEDPNLYNDDMYSFLVNIPFTFCFYDSTFNSLVIGSNGLLSFDVANAGCANAYTISQPIPYAGGTICMQSSTYYPKAAIMGAYSDLDPRLVAGPPDRKIEWRTEGTAPYRRFVASYYHVGVYSTSGSGCSLATPTTFQMVFYESTGIIEVFVEQKTCLTSTNGGKAIMGVQNWNRDKARWPTGKNNAVWTESRTAYRFTPSGPVSQFVSSDLLTLGGSLIAHGDTATTTAGLLDVTFPGFCQSTAADQYIIKTTYNACGNPSPIVVTDTITVNRTTSLNATETHTPSNCGIPGTGTATITVPAGIGTAPYTFVLNPTGASQSGSSPQVFTALTAGNYSVHVTDAGGGCSSDVPVVITATGTLPVNYNVINTSCFGKTVANGGINVTTPAATPTITYTVYHPTAPTFTYTQTGNGSFNNLIAGNYLLSVVDNVGCQALNIPFTVNAGPSITMTHDTLPTLCPGASNGSIIITGCTGTPPYQYTINALPNPGNVFSNLAAGTYLISLVDAIGCEIDFESITVTDGVSGVTGTATPVSTACAGINDGKIIVTPSSGSGPYQFSIDNGLTWQASNTFSGLAPGTYTILIKESICTSGPISATVTAGSGLQSTLTQTPTTCPGALNGKINVTVNSGSAPYTFVLDGTITQTSAINSITFNNVSAGLHNITITDVNGCINASPVSITVQAGTGFTAGFSPTPTGCAGASNGKLDITVQAPGTAPFTAVLSPGAITQTSATTSITFNNLASGNYSVLITDVNGCQFTLNNMNVASGAGLTATASNTSTSCAGVNNGTVTITMANGTAPFTALMDGTITQTSATNTISFSNVMAGVHNITVKDANGCITTSGVSTTVATGSGFASVFTPTATSCAGINNGKLDITAQTPGAAPFTVVLNPGAITQTSATSLITFNNLAPGTYNALITDANGCQSTLSNINVASGAGLNAAASNTSTSCAGVNNGTVTITMANGTAPFTALMDGTITQTGATNTISFSNVMAGVHNITVKDANGCITTSAVSTTVATGSGFASVFTPTATSCAGINNGKLDITAQTPGAAPFTVVLNPGAITLTSATSLITFNNLAPGTYNALITDANGCQSTLSNMNVASGAGLNAAASNTSTSCAGVNNGTVTITMANGTAPFTALMDGTITQTGATNTISFSNVMAGVHNITVKDANGCITTSAVSTTVATGTGFTSTFIPTPTSCAGAVNGKLVITAQTPGTAPFTIVLNPGAITQTSATSSITFNNLASGNYSALITDANGCQSTLNNMSVAAGAGLIASASNTSTACTGINNGTVTITMGSGTAPFAAVMDATINQASGSNTISFSNVIAGTHNITITDINGCVTTSPVTTTVAIGSGFTAAYAPTATSCSGAINGKLVITAQSPGTAPFTVVLNPGTITQTSATSSITFNNLAAGNYSAVVTDANGCQFNLNNMTVAAGNPLNASADPLTTTCNGANNGSIVIQQPTNGTAPYLYSLNSGAPQAGSTFSGLTAGPYSINVTDAAGCSSGSLNVIISAGPPINVTPSKMDVSCFGSLTGSITAVPSTNATVPIQYSLDNATWQASPNFTGLIAGPYTIYIKDAAGCSNSNAVTIIQPLQLTAATSQQSVLCNGGSNGKIIVAAGGGTAPYSYSLDNINFQPANTFDVAAGSYTVYVRDANGCTVAPITNIDVAEPAVLTALSATTNASCDGGNDGTITITPAGGVSPYQFAITGSSFQPANNFNVAPGNYDITVKDVNGCSYPLPGIVVGLTNNLSFTPMIDLAPICESYTVSLRLITNATQFTWDHIATLSNNGIANPIAQPSVSTLYTVTATLGRCSIIDDVFVPVMAAPVPDAGPAPPNGICYGQTYQLQGSGGVTYSWSPTATISDSSVNNPVVKPDKTTTYTLNVTDANGCPSVIPGKVVVEVTPPIKVTVYPADTVVYAGAQIPMLATSIGTDYIWSSVSGTAGLNNPAIPNPVALAPLIDGSIIQYDVKATTAAGCEGRASVTIRVAKGPEIYVATAFSPNGDGKNEFFIPFPVGIKQMNYFRVFNRWGQLMYSSQTLNQGWDGRFGGMEQPSGVYVWMAQGVTTDNKIITKQGTVTLIR